MRRKGQKVLGRNTESGRILLNENKLNQLPGLAVLFDEAQRVSGSIRSFKWERGQ